MVYIMIKTHIILASASPRRRELMAQICDSYEICPSDVDESGVEHMTAAAAVTELSKRKALSVSYKCNDLVLAADTMVALEGKLLGKPADEKEAYEMLKALSGKAHEVYTGVTLAKAGKCLSDFECTKVYFRELEDDEIWEYIATDSPMDKAGSYGIQEVGSFVRKIDGDFFNVIGLPLCKCYEMIKAF